MQRAHAKLIPILVRLIVQSWGDAGHGTQAIKPVGHPRKCGHCPVWPDLQSRQPGLIQWAAIAHADVSKLAAVARVRRRGHRSILAPSPASGITRDAR